MDSTREQLQEKYDQSLLFADGFDSCIIGIASDFGSLRVVYSIPKMLDTLFNDEGMPYSEAMEYLEFNTLTAWVGDQTPIYVESEECFMI